METKPWRLPSKSMSGEAELSPNGVFTASSCLYAQSISRGKVQASASIAFPRESHASRGERRRFMQLADLLKTDASLYDIQTSAQGPSGELPLTDEILKTWSSGDLFGLTQAAGMGWKPEDLLGEQYLIVSTQGGVRAPDGIPIALGYHTGHWEVGLLVQAAAKEIKASGGVPFAAFVSDPCDGRTQGTTGMFDSLPYRNDAAIVMRRLIRSLPQRSGLIGVATCDKGLPAMMMALAGLSDLPCVLVPGRVTLPPESGEDAGKIH